MNTGYEEQLMTERFTPTGHRQQRTSLRDGNRREEQRKKWRRAGHGVRNQFYGKKIRLRCLKQHLYWLPIKDYQIPLPDNYETMMIFSSLNKCTLSISLWFLVEWTFFFPFWDFPSVDSECSNMFLEHVQTKYILFSVIYIIKHSGNRRTPLYNVTIHKYTL